MAYFHRTHRPAECVAHCQALLLDAGVLQSTLPVYFHLIWTNSLPSSTRPCFPGPAVPSSTGRVGWLKRRRKSLHERIGSGAFPTPRIGSLSLSLNHSTRMASLDHGLGTEFDFKSNLQAWQSLCQVSHHTLLHIHDPWGSKVSQWLLTLLSNGLTPFWLPYALVPYSVPKVAF